MNESGKQLPNGPDSHPAQHTICDACKKKDDEDIYIVFNVLYRVIIGDIFYQRLTKDDLNMDVELLQEERSKQMTEEAKSGEEKLHLFQQEVSSEILIEIMTSSHFDQLLQEIFKSKYSRINEATCNHQDFARHFIECFNISNHHVKKERTSLKLDRLDALLISIRKLKEDIQKYNAEISRLPNHIMTRLFESHASTAKKNLIRVEDAEINHDFSGNGKEDDSRQARSSNNSNNTSGNVQSSSCNGTFGSTNGRSELSTNYESNGNNDSSGSNQNNGSGEGGSSDQSTESNNVNDVNEPNRKRSKALPFKSKLPKKATDILKTWFLSNINNPYPSHEAKESLSKLTGLTRKQIQNWFTNSRKRFLEPLKKKMEGKKSTGLTPSDLPTIEPVVDVPPAQIINNTILSQPIPEVPIQPNPQLKPVTQFISPIATIAPMNNNPSILKPIMPQRLQLPMQQPQIQNQAFLYQPGVLPQGLPQGVLPQGVLQQVQQGTAMQHGNNILIVPYIVPQSAPVTYYRQPEFVAVNPSFIQFPQGNVGGMGNIGPNTPNVANMGNMGNVQQLEQQSPVNQNQMVQYPYFVPMQQHGLVEMRPGLNPNLSNNYNTINNNIYNNINGLNGIGSGMGSNNMSNMGQMIPITLGNPNITPLMNVGSFGGIPQQANISGMSHMDPNLMRTVERPGSVSKSNQGDFSGNIFDGNITSPRTMQRNIGGIYHPRPELDEMNLQGRKHLHKDHNPENDTN